MVVVVVILFMKINYDVICSLNVVFHRPNYDVLLRKELDFLH